MKAPIKIIMLFAVLLISNLAIAGTGQPVFTIKDSGEKTFSFDTKEMSSSFVEVIFQDENGNKVFGEYAIHPATFERKYNLSELVNGTYYLVVKSDTETQILPISITKDGLKMDFKELETM